jgi:hypothetical protein
MRAVSDFDRIASNIAIWHGYDSAVKAELYSTCLLTAADACLVDPIPLESEALGELVGSRPVAGIIVELQSSPRLWLVRGAILSSGLCAFGNILG